MKIGILSLQGAVNPHIQKLQELSVTAVPVKRKEDLAGLSGLILPGGESTTMVHLLKVNEMWEELCQFVRTRPTWGVCAGTILLAKKVSCPEQVSLAAMDIEVERNSYGRQIDSFISWLEPTKYWQDNERLEGIFIRAPRIRAMHANTRPLMTFEKEVVLAEGGHLLSSTFHPELSSSTKIHEYFIKKCNLSGASS